MEGDELVLAFFELDPLTAGAAGVAVAGVGTLCADDKIARQK